MRLAGDTQWLRLEPRRRGERVFRGDRLRTGAPGRARLELSDRIEARNIGPSVVNVGWETEIDLEQFKFDLTDPPRRQGVIGLIRGVLRAFFKGFAQDSSNLFVVRTGASLCGIRGSDVMVEYDGYGHAVYYIDHGSVAVEAGGGSATPPPGHKIEVRGERIGEPVPMSPGEWSRMLDLTHPDEETPPL